MRMWLVRKVRHTLIPYARPKFVTTCRANTPAFLSTFMYLINIINTYNIAIF